MAYPKGRPFSQKSAGVPLLLPHPPPPRLPLPHPPLSRPPPPRRHLPHPCHTATDTGPPMPRRRRHAAIATPLMPRCRSPCQASGAPDELTGLSRLEVNEWLFAIVLHRSTPVPIASNSDCHTLFPLLYEGYVRMSGDAPCSVLPSSLWRGLYGGHVWAMQILVDSGFGSPGQKLDFKHQAFQGARCPGRISGCPRTYFSTDSEGLKRPL